MPVYLIVLGKDLVNCCLAVVLSSAVGRLGFSSCYCSNICSGIEETANIFWDRVSLYSVT